MPWVKKQVSVKFIKHQTVWEAVIQEVKHVRTKNDGEYHGHFDVYCKKQKIVHKNIPPKTPHWKF